MHYTLEYVESMAFSDVHSLVVYWKKHPPMHQILGGIWRGLRGDSAEAAPKADPEMTLLAEKIMSERPSLGEFLEMTKAHAAN